MRYWTVMVLPVVFASIAHAGWMGRGQVGVIGEIMESACAIHTDDVWQEISFGTVPHRAVREGGEGRARGFSIRLTNCELERENGGIWQTAEISFDGEPDLWQPGLFAVQGEGRGVGLGIFDASGEQARPGKPLSGIALEPGSREIFYQMNVIHNGGDLTLGDWKSHIRFTVAYQ